MSNTVFQPFDDQIRLDAEEIAAFMRQGEYWHLAYGGQVIMLRHGKGLEYLAELLRRPGQRVPVTQLAPGSPGESEAGGHAALERARSAVTKRIRDALQRIEKNHPPLGRFLNGRVRTGYRCIYQPDPEQPVAWQL